MRPLARALAVLAVVLCARPASSQAWLGASTGTVEAATLGQDRWTPLGRGVAPLAAGTHVRTAPDGAATIVFADHSRVRLGHGTELILDELGPKGAAVKVQNGSLEGFAVKASAPSLRVRTQTAFASASDAEFSVEVSALKDTQLVVYGGAVTVRLQNGESAEFGEGKEFRSVMVVAGRPLRLLPHPREDAGSKTGVAAGPVAASGAPTAPVVAHDWPDCLHKKNGAIRDAIEDVAACQRRERSRLNKTGDMTLADAADLRTHQEEELREYARARGWMPAALDGEPDAASGDATASAAGGGAGGADGSAEGAGYVPGMDAALAKSLQGMGFDPTSAEGMTGGGNLSDKDQALLKQIQSGGGQVTPSALNMLFQSLLGGAAKGSNAAKPSSGSQ